MIELNNGNPVAIEHTISLLGVIATFLVVIVAFLVPIFVKNRNINHVEKNLRKILKNSLLQLKKDIDDILNSEDIETSGEKYKIMFSPTNLPKFMSCSNIAKDLFISQISNIREYNFEKTIKFFINYLTHVDILKERRERIEQSEKPTLFCNTIVRIQRKLDDAISELSGKMNGKNTLVRKCSLLDGKDCNKLCSINEGYENKNSKKKNNN